ncbi:trehalose-phosphatase [Salinarimonas soli]|uniref:Trehalose 6-phosphate phosphatase n=1 Tax=Salinarimonas soli TaxID=1638099 RepID=A0A5B2VED3_9HYPH|nr:trehalose-phosphatase [Salinarimonas soli]KAA2237334.1 trehalose-phosphatase [Salinarimonas soli]
MPDALFLDFDGTLVEIVGRPDAVAVDPSLPGILTRLRERLGGALALVSGRPVATLDGFLDPFSGDAAGLHGVEHRIGGHFFPCDPQAHPALRRGVDRLRDAVAGWPGVLVEDKGCSVALHWRLAPGHAAEAHRLMQELAGDLGGSYRLQGGKAVAEILPAFAGKGPIIERFMQEPPYRGRRPVFIGDDLTDENGFAVVNHLGGLSVRIGGGESIAAVHLPDPTSLRAALARWAELGRVDLG